MKSSSCSALCLALSAAFAGCSGARVDRMEWQVMGTVAAIQTRSSTALASQSDCRRIVQDAFADVERLLNAHDPESELSRLSSLTEDEILSGCDKERPRFPWLETRPCYEAAFKLMKASGGAFNPRWRGPKTLDRRASRPRGQP